MSVFEMVSVVGREFGVSVDLCKMSNCYFVHVQGYDKVDVIPGLHITIRELSEKVQNILG